MNSRHYDIEKLKRLREERGLSQDAVAKHLKINRQTIYRAEKGIKVPYELLCDLSELYDVEVISLLYPKPLPACECCS